MLNVALWVVQGLLAGVFLLTGTTKLVLPREVLEKRMHWAPSWPRWRIKLLGLAEVAGALGLVLPASTGVAPILSPIAALCLAVLMLGAAGTHRRLGESVIPALLVGALCLVVGAARLHLSVPSPGGGAMLRAGDRAGALDRPRLATHMIESALAPCATA